MDKNYFILIENIIFTFKILKINTIFLIKKYLKPLNYLKNSQILKYLKDLH